MRWWFFLPTLLTAAAALAVETGPRPASPVEVELFKDAMKNTGQDTEHWAYTESTIVRDKKGRVRGETVVRFDPSKPYAEQFTPLKIDGKPPTAKQLRQHRERGEQRGEQHARTAGKTADAVDEPPQVRINDSKATMDIDHPQVVQDGEAGVTFEIPLLSRSKDIPADKLQILVQVGKKARQIERAALRVREPFRLMMVAKVKAGEASMAFTVVDPNFGPVITSMTGNFGASILFVPVNATFASTRTEWQRVKAYDERFNVKLAPLQFPGF